MDSAFTIRPTTNADAPAIRDLVFAALIEHGLTPDPPGTDADLYDIESAYAGGAFDVLVDSEGSVIGTVGLMPHGDGCCELRKMYVSPTHRGRGYGRRLLNHAADQARRLGFTRVELETASVLQAAIRLYESFGFRPFTPEHMTAGPERADRAYFLEL